MRRRILLLACVAFIVSPFANADSQISPHAPKAFARRNVGGAAAKANLKPHLIKSDPIDLEYARGMVSPPLAHSRGGACDSDAVLFSKIAVGVVLEAAALFGVVLGGKALSSLPELAKFPQIDGLHVVQWASLVIVIFASSLIGSFIDGGLSAASNQVLDPNATPGDPNWYRGLKRPSWEPPGWVFPIMWLIVSKPTQLWAVSRLFKVVDIDAAFLFRALLVYCTHLSLGDSWNKVFFGFQCPGKGAIVISTFWALLATSAFLFWSIDEKAGHLMLPTCAWVSIATALNWSIYINN
uniref:Uncharacterized protein n=1 Tax=Odontella aurita TaxID=265563 RepID=A0A7S4JTL6_9STRA|mmetsp:Transcript_53875/g.161191  ORF Transcript_53875/g.161191 Transcript_53875/m.161191 type:complete len:296 (+) Transcript_53875:103-990(+)